MECGVIATRQHSKLNMVNETKPEKLGTTATVSPAWNSTSSSSMAIGMTSTNYDLYEHDNGQHGGGMVAEELRRSTSFTPGGILPPGYMLFGGRGSPTMSLKRTRL